MLITDTHLSGLITLVLFHFALPQNTVRTQSVSSVLSVYQKYLRKVLWYLTHSTSCDDCNVATEQLFFTQIHTNMHTHRHTFHIHNTTDVAVPGSYKALLTTTADTLTHTHFHPDV